MSSEVLTLTALRGFPLIEPGDDLAGRIIEAVQRDGIVPCRHDVFVLAQKIVSKAEGRYVNLDEVVPTALAVKLGAMTEKDPRIVELIHAESREVIKLAPGVMVAEHRLGFVMANAGIDQSNIEHLDGRERALLLPVAPDESCAALKARFDEAFGVEVAVVINDSFGRPWRKGVTGVALGAAGLPALQSLIGKPDLFGREMRVTEIALADEVAAAASILMGQTAAGQPVVHMRGLQWDEPARPAADLVRPRSQDLFR